MSTFPLSVRNPREVRLSSLSPSILSRAHSGKTLVQSAGAQWWQVDASWPPLTRAQAHQLLAYLMTLSGRYETFEFTPPNTNPPRGVGQSAIAGDDILVHDASTPAGSTSLWTKAWVPSTANVLLPGDLIRFSGHSKVYMITQAASSAAGAEGYAQLRFRPGLLSAVVANQVVTVYDVPITCRLASDLTSVTADYAMRYGLSVQMEESW